MTYYDKIKLLKEIFANVELINEEDKPSIIAYIKGVSDTRERINMEKVCDFN